MRMKKFAAIVLCCAPALALTGCSKPSESDLHKNLVEDFKGEGIPDEQATKIADCAAPKLHKELGASSLNTIIDDGVVGAKVDKDDADAGDKILEDCAKTAMGG